MSRPVNISENFCSLKVLVAPLDWGLGHYTRCIPLIRKLLAQQNEVTLAATEAGAALLRKEFPSLNILTIPSYGIRYPQKGTWFMWKMLLQLPDIYRAIRKENKWLNKLQQEKNFDVVISDNRMGLYHPDITCVYITHQLAIRTGHVVTDFFARKLHYHFIEKFTVCWVPDQEGHQNLAGALSHPNKKPNIPLLYIGPLSRFVKIEAEKKFDIVYLISGPEPQRSIFEDLLIGCIKNSTEKIVIVRGLPENTDTPISLPSNVEVYNHLPAKQLNELLASAKKIVARSGYSTIMDLEVLGVNAILVPTPGQTEQEYLASYLLKSGKHEVRMQDELRTRC